MKPLTFTLVVFALVALTIFPVWVLAGCIKLSIPVEHTICIVGGAVLFSVGIGYMLIKSFLTFKD